jgi:hypothetical protein
MNSAIDVRSQFRINGMDLARADQAEAREQHWILREPVLREWVGKIEQCYRRLAAAGFQPFGDDPISPKAVIDALGFCHEPEPRGFIRHAAFTARMLKAATAEGLRIEREIEWLRRNGAPPE